MKSKKIMRTVIIILSVLLAASIVALGITLISKYINGKNSQSVTIPNHLINTSSDQQNTEDDDCPNDDLSQKGEGSGENNTASSGVTDQSEDLDQENGNGQSQMQEGVNSPSLNQSGENATNIPSVGIGSVPSEEQISPDDTVKEDTEDGSNDGSAGEGETQPKAQAIELHNKNPEDNRPFQVQNMFPGDSITQYYCVKVSYVEFVTMRFRADTRPGYEKLAQAMKCKVILMNTGKTLYDGTFRNMPEAISYQLPESGEATTAELYYQITVYLDTSAGNEYQNQTLTADFRWWVEETGNLKPPVQSGDEFNTYLWAGTAIAAAVALVMLKKKRRRL